MKKNNLLKIVTISAMIIIVLTSFSYAAPIIPEVAPGVEGEKVQQVAKDVLATIRWIGYAIGVGMLMFVGIKYIMASADERASLKGILVKVVIGSLILIGANMIVGIVYNFSQQT